MQLLQTRVHRENNPSHNITWGSRIDSEAVGRTKGCRDIFEDQLDFDIASSRFCDALRGVGLSMPELETKPDSEAVKSDWSFFSFDHRPTM
jgi:hypothetical protein